jgi:acyl dehydratase
METNMPDDGFGLNTIERFIGRELGVSDWVAMDQERINQFAACTNDHQWIHVDLQRARRESPLGTTIAHGFLLLAMLAESTFEILVKPAGFAQALNYGLDRVRFISPVRAGARIRIRMKLLTADAKGQGRTLLSTENTMEIEGEAKPALIATSLVMAINARAD